MIIKEQGSDRMRQFGLAAPAVHLTPEQVKCFFMQLGAFDQLFDTIMGGGVGELAVDLGGGILASINSPYWRVAIGKHRVGGDGNLYMNQGISLKIREWRDLLNILDHVCNAIQDFDLL